MQPIIPYAGEDLFSLAKRCDALYICPKVDGLRKGPLVVYAGKDENERNFVGDIYFNFRKIEAHPQVVHTFAEAACAKLFSQGLLNSFDTVLGIPHGGRTFGQELARIAGKRFSYADKKPMPTEPGRKQEYYWDTTQFEFEKGERVVIAEDVFNNFQNTYSTLCQIESTGVKVVLLAGALNRSPIYDTFYPVKYSDPHPGAKLPVIASITEAYPEYRQDDPEVIEDIKKGNLELEVKKNWAKLAALMNQYQTQIV